MENKRSSTSSVLKNNMYTKGKQTQTNDLHSFIYNNKKLSLNRFPFQQLWQFGRQQLWQDRTQHRHISKKNLTQNLNYLPASTRVTFSTMNMPQNRPTLKVVHAGAGCGQKNSILSMGQNTNTFSICCNKILPCMSLKVLQ